ncbi:hypothetical protein [Gluconobacter oxydans]|uniref:hypothetical protein n=1 Tax=Gluconobacter oxydans TaxID=442 RepID=UPI0039E794BE
MWQPLSKTKGTQGNILFSHHASSTGGGLSILITHVISSWSYVEASFGIVMAAFLKGNGKTAAAMYSTINTFRAQEDALKAAASLSLNEEDHNVFLDVLLSVKPMAKVRHHFAHWLWGSCDTLPNHMLLVRPQELWIHHANVRAHAYQLTEDQIKNTDFEKFDRSKIQVWSAESLSQAVMNVDLCADLVKALADYLETPPGPSRDLLYRQMYLQPLMQKAQKKRQGKS